MMNARLRHIGFLSQLIHLVANMIEIGCHLLIGYYKTGVVGIDGVVIDFPALEFVIF